ncbi:MAG: hypothetical protein M9918_12205 [Anaerolineae bacterium]|nr:hypothetical protein [Anaerolineae bacterium]MCO5188939.1 hypothetical protein [Anaerolineae bacterium]MCO5195843.1 hypothetical protein [Anaerolineae bacterium]
MAKKSTISTNLFQPTVPVEPAQNQIERQTWPMREEQPKHHTSTRIPLNVYQYFEELAVEHGYSVHSLRIYAMTWFVREHKAGRIRLERDRSVTSKRVLSMPEIE